MNRSSRHNKVLPEKTVSEAPRSIPLPSDPKKDDSEIIDTILKFWQKIPKSSLQELAEHVEVLKATTLWEKRAKAFYHRFASQPTDSSFQVVWNEVRWKDYRSVQLMGKDGSYFLYPFTCFRFQGITRTFYDQLMSRWDVVTEKTVERFLESVWAIARDLLAEFSEDDLACLKAAAKYLDDRTVLATGEPLPQFFARETGMTPRRLTKALYRLYAYGILQGRSYINFPKIGLKPYLFVSQRNLEDLESDYCFFQVESLEKRRQFSGLVVPPTAIKMGWHENVKAEGLLASIQTFSACWNLTRLTTNGWGPYPLTTQEKSENKALGQVTLEFQGSPIPLRQPDLTYLEKVQGLSARILRGEYGTRVQQRLHELSDEGVLISTSTFRSIQCGATIFLYCRGNPEMIASIKENLSHFPLFRTLQGTNWLLTALLLPTTWVYPALLDLKTYCSTLSLDDFLVDVHQGAAERFIQFSKLWDQESREWIA